MQTILFLQMVNIKTASQRSETVGSSYSNILYTCLHLLSGQKISTEFHTHRPNVYLHNEPCDNLIA